MAYKYIKNYYGFDAIVGRRVKHSDNDREGVIARESGSNQHYVQVKFDGVKHSMPCHPMDLTYI